MLAVSRDQHRPLTARLIMIILRSPRRTNRLVPAGRRRQRTPRCNCQFGPWQWGEFPQVPVMAAAPPTVSKQRVRGDTRSGDSQGALVADSAGWGPGHCCPAARHARYLKSGRCLRAGAIRRPCRREDHSWMRGRVRARWMAPETLILPAGGAQRAGSNRRPPAPRFRGGYGPVLSVVLAGSGPAIPVNFRRRR
jgi:hypothetical protein